MKFFEKLLLLSGVVLTVLGPTSAFAYGVNVSTGKGIACALTIKSQTINRTSCAAHVISESKAPPVMLDVTGAPYTRPSRRSSTTPIALNQKLIANSLLSMAKLKMVSLERSRS